jgi:hypothetical protein
VVKVAPLVVNHQGQLRSPADLRNGAAQVSIAMIIEAASVGGLFRSNPFKMIHRAGIPSLTCWTP